MNDPEIRFTGEEFDGAEDELGKLYQTFRAVANDQVVIRRGDEALPDPSDIEITPSILEEPFFVVNAWHQTNSEVYPGVFQRQDFTLRILEEGEDVYLSAYDSESNQRYRLTTRETLFLMRVAQIAAYRTLLRDTDRGE